MRIFLIVALIFVAANLRAQSGDVQDSIRVDKRKIEKVIKEIKSRPELKSLRHFIKDFDRRKVTFSYPGKFLRKRGFKINVLYKGEIILMYDISPDTYQLGQIIDLR